MKLTRFCLFLLGLVVSTRGSVTVSGLSSGAAFAIQFHVAFSSDVSGSGTIAGAPYYCGMDNISIVHTTCSTDPASISIPDLVAFTQKEAADQLIDPTGNLYKAKVYLYSGTKDKIVNPDVVKDIKKYFRSFMPEGNIKTEFTIPSEHAFITNSYGNKCSHLGSPFINNCNYDAAGEILQWLLGDLEQPVDPIDDNFLTLEQKTYLPPSSTLTNASLDDRAYVYVPSVCQTKGGCKVHVAFHGCDQTLKSINTTFVHHTGYNGWAEANNIVVLYPQAKAIPLNKKGCWDWWGFTGTNYATQFGPQMATVKNIIDYLSKKY